MQLNLYWLCHICRILALFLAVTLPVNAKLIVVYPDVPSPYDQIFEEILSGVEDHYSEELVLRALNKNETPDNILAWLNNEKPEMIIALGRRGYKVAQKIEKDKPVVVGALPIKPNGVSGISLIGDPKLLFDALSGLAPEIKTVHVVYNPSNEWLIGIAEQQAATMGLQLKTKLAQNVKSAVQIYESLLKDIDAQSEALWLPLDPITANEQVILPNLLERSWEKNIVLFSSKPAHAKRGALFSMFPDHQALGAELVDMVQIINTTRRSTGVEPLKKMRLAVNLRTAAHLGFEYKPKEKDEFHLTFPQ